MFKFNEERGQFETEINGIEFVCDEIYEGCEDFVRKVANCYQEKLESIVEYMLEEGIENYFGKQTVESIKETLGKPQIDASRYLLAYLEHTLDYVHIIEIEFNGALDEFLYMNIDG